MLSEKQKSMVYVITNTKNNKKYVGSSKNPSARYQCHMSQLKHGRHPNKDLQKDFDLYGNCYEMSIECEKTKTNQDSEEFQVMKKYRTYDARYGYNNNDMAMNPIRKSQGLSYKRNNYQGKAETKESELFLSKNIRYLRKKFNLSQEDFAKEFGYESLTTIQKWEKNENIPPLKTVIAMAKRFSVSLDDFVCRDLEKGVGNIIFDTKPANLGERIKNRRKELRMSQDELAKKCGYKSRSSIQKLEASRRKLNISQVKKIADALNVSTPYLMGYAEEHI